MSVYDMIQALAEHWNDTVSCLDPSDVRLIEELLRGIAAAPDDEEAARMAASDLATLLAARLPKAHPVRSAISDGQRLAGSPADLSRAAAALRATLAITGVLLARVASANPSAVPPEQVDSDADAWLLAAPAFTDEEVRSHGGDPRHEHLIRLVPSHGPARLPAFQFDPAGRPVAVVVSINRLLRVDEDPWGVADWWLGRNAWLEGIPAELLGHVDEELLVLAARAEIPQE